MEEANGKQTAHDEFKRTLREYWGYPDFRGIQRDIIESIAQGRDTCLLYTSDAADEL